MIASASSPVVLIVEDEAMIRMGAAAIVEDLGCEFFEASSADEAIALLDDSIRRSRSCSPTFRWRDRWMDWNWLLTPAVAGDH